MDKLFLILIESMFEIFYHVTIVMRRIKKNR